jgi:RNA polymerase-binding transcription factor DksA
MAKTAKSQAKKAGSKKSAAAGKSTNKPATQASTAKKAAPKKAAAEKAGPRKGAAKKSQRKPPTKKKSVKSPFDKKFLDEMSAALHTERKRYLRSAESLKAEADALMEGREPGDVQFDEESGEGDTLAVERERDLALSAHARAAVDEIDDALDRLAMGTYGICVVSHKPIPKERLRAIPWAAERVEVKAGGFGLR